MKPIKVEMKPIGVADLDAGVKMNPIKVKMKPIRVADLNIGVGMKPIEQNLLDGFHFYCDAL